MDLTILGTVFKSSPYSFIWKKIEKASLSTPGFNEHKFSQSSLGSIGITLNNL